jgi:hypothetical protein
MYPEGIYKDSFRGRGGEKKEEKEIRKPLYQVDITLFTVI